MGVGGTLGESEKVVSCWHRRPAFGYPKLAITLAALKVPLGFPNVEAFPTLYA